MKLIISLIISCFILNFSQAQTVGGWGNCEFATELTLQAFIPTDAFSCKKAFVQSTNQHYIWDGSYWVSINLNNIYTSDGTLDTNRIVNMNSFDLIFESGVGSNFIIDGFTGSSRTNPIFQIDRDVDRALSFFHSNDSETGYWTLGTEDGIALELDELTGKGIYLQETGNVGIGTATPAAKLDVAEGSVRFSEYGNSTYQNTETATQILGVEDDGDVVEMNTAKSSRIFYPPSITIQASTLGTGFTIDLHQQYVDEFGAPAVSSAGAPTAIPTYAETELYYYVTYFDNTIFQNISIDANGIMEYDIIKVPLDNCSFVNIVFVVK